MAVDFSPWTQTFFLQKLKFSFDASLYKARFLLGPKCGLVKNAFKGADRLEGSFCYEQLTHFRTMHTIVVFFVVSKRPFERAPFTLQLPYPDVSFTIFNLGKELLF